MAAEDDDQITFDSGLVGTIFLQAPLPALACDLTIAGPPSGAVTLSGSSQFPLFEISEGYEVTINDLHLTQGLTTNGGAAFLVRSQAIVTFSYGSLTNCVATQPSGSAIYIEKNGLFTGCDVTYLGNSSAGFGGDAFLSPGAALCIDCSKDVGLMEIFGSGDVMKQGVGNAFFLTSYETPLTLTIYRGTVSAFGVWTQPSIVFGQLQGEQTALYLVNQGVVKPSETLVTLQDYYQDSMGVLDIVLSPQSNGKLRIGGNAYLSGALQLAPTKGNYQVGAIYTIVETTGQISGTFDTVDSLSMAFNVHYFPNRVDIEIVGL